MEKGYILTERQKRIVNELMAMKRSKEYATELVLKANPMTLLRHNNAKEVAEHLLQGKEVRRESSFRKAIREEGREMSEATKKMSKPGVKKQKKRRRRR